MAFCDSLGFLNPASRQSYLFVRYAEPALNLEAIATFYAFQLCAYVLAELMTLIPYPVAKVDGQVAVFSDSDMLSDNQSSGFFPLTDVPCWYFGEIFFHRRHLDDRTSKPIDLLSFTFGLLITLLPGF
jgi:hypothetical protein